MLWLVLVSLLLGPLAAQELEHPATPVVSQPELVETLIPMIVGWALDGSVLPGTEGTNLGDYKDRDYLVSGITRGAGAVVVVSVLVDGEVVNFSLDVQPRQLTPITAEVAKGYLDTATHPRHQHLVVSIGAEPRSRLGRNPSEDDDFELSARWGLYEVIFYVRRVSSGFSFNPVSAVWH